MIDFFLHSPEAILDFSSDCIASLWRSSTLFDYYFKFSFVLTAILYIAKEDFIYGDWAVMNARKAPLY